jgi:tetratricopeptide (TPR) repeat protein
LGHFDRARELYDEALSRGHHPALENNRCYSLYLQGRLDRAETCFRKVLSRDPENQMARNNLGLVLCRQGREAEALVLWQEVLTETESRERLGQALTALGREAPPNVAAAEPAPAEKRAAAVASAAVSPVPEASGPRAQIQDRQEGQRDSLAQLKSSSPGPLASQDQNLTLASPSGEGPKEKETQAATPIPAPATAQPPQLAEKRENHPPEPDGALSPESRTPPQVVGATSESGKEQSWASQDTSVIKESQEEASPVLTALELLDTGIELKNGNGANDFARIMRRRLISEGFTVVGIGNHIDFGLEETVIAHRSKAAHVAQVLAQKFFPGAKLEDNGDMSPRADIRVSMGRDLLNPQKVAADGPGPVPPAAPVTTAPEEKDEKIAASGVTPTPPTPDFLAALKLYTMRIELRNGNGVAGQAREFRRRLRTEGFRVASIGNHIDFGLEKTVIAYRPEAARVAQVLSKKFFPGASFEEGGPLSPGVDVRVSLGWDMIPGRGQLARNTP